MRSGFVVFAGGAMFLASFAHALMGWPALKPELVKVGAPENLSGALEIGWHFGSAAMAAMGLVVVNCGWRLRRADRSGVTAALLVAACYFSFGLYAFVARGMAPHFTFFMAVGLLAGLPLLGGRARGPAEAGRGRGA